MQVRLIGAQVKSGAGVCSDWLGRRRTDRSVTLPPPPGWRVPRVTETPGREGRSGAPVTTAGQEPRETMADLGTRVAMADREPREAMADREPRVAMADREPREAMTDRETWEAMADREPRVAMADREPREAMAYFFPVARAGQEVPWPWS